MLSAGVGFAIGSAVGFATASDRIGVPPLLGAVGLLLGLGVAASTRIWERRKTATVRRPRATALPERPERDVVPPPGKGAAEDDQWIVPPGWYPDPGGTPLARYWNGTRWTEEVAESI